MYGSVQFDIKIETCPYHVLSINTTWRRNIGSYRHTTLGLWRMQREGGTKGELVVEREEVRMKLMSFAAEAAVKSGSVKDIA